MTYIVDFGEASGLPVDNCMASVIVHVFLRSLSNFLQSTPLPRNSRYDESVAMLVARLTIGTPCAC